MKAWSISRAGLVPVAAAEPRAEPHDVIVAMRAASLNFRDLRLGGAAAEGYVPCSDGAGEVVAVGGAVSRFRVGDRVVLTFYTGWASGEMPADALSIGRGQLGNDGVLAERVRSHEDWLLPIPDDLSFEEAATLPCAALTAWHALIDKAALRQGQTVLVLGTGGVSVFALQFAKAAGARVVVTSSSDEKLARAEALGADACINYRRTPAWHDAVRAATGGRGVDVVVEVSGGETIEQSIDALVPGGRIMLIGARSGFGGAPLLSLMMKAASISAVLVGSRAMFAAMLASIAVNGLRPVIDHTLPFDRAPDGFAAFEKSGHFGKIVLTSSA